MPKVNHRRRNRTDGTRSGGSLTKRTYMILDEAKAWRTIGWRRFRRFVRAVINNGTPEHAPKGGIRRRGSITSEPGWSPPRAPREEK